MGSAMFTYDLPAKHSSPAWVDALPFKRPDNTQPVRVLGSRVASADALRQTRAQVSKQCGGPT